ncbi:BrnT family toxin [Candidatus Glomeribacter gigasporarum]|nr:BrnT family toxin [Candidatus Glomeribacter gigasporarum]
MRIMQFDFDPQKAALNLAKHKVSFDEACTALLDARALTRADPDSVDEARWVTLGMTTAGRLVVVVWTERGDTLRLISARKATKREEKCYA